MKKQRKMIIISIICFMFIMVGGYAAFQTNLNITAKGNIVDRSRVIQSWTSTSNEDFHTDYYRENIVSATFLNTNQVASNATESWDVSVDKDKGVMAWVVPNSEDSTKYDLYIGANKGVIANENSGFLFYYFTGMKTIDFQKNFDTSNVTDMRCMFMGDSNLIMLDVSSFVTHNVTNMGDMFEKCRSLKTLDLSNFDTSNVTNMAWLFNGCSSLTNLNISSFNTSNVTRMPGMFVFCSSLTSLDLRHFDTSNVTDMNDMFGACTKLESLDLTSFNTSNVTNMSRMFNACESLTNLDLCTFDTRKVTNMRYMFQRTLNISVISVGPNWTINQADTTDMFTGSGTSTVTTGQC